MRQVTVIVSAIVSAALTFSAAACLNVAGARASDLGKPTTLDTVLAYSPDKPLTGCYGEAGTAGTFFHAGDRNAAGSIGLGCAGILKDLAIVGGGIRADFGSVNAGEVYLKAGPRINPNLTVYGLMGVRAVDWKFASNPTLQLGAGLETTLIDREWSVFLEGETAAARLGGTPTKDDVTVRAGIRYWFGK